MCRMRSTAPQTHPSVIEVVPLDGFSLVVTFDSGEEGVLEMKTWLGPGPFQEIATYQDFRTAHVANGTIEWDCGVGLDPEYVYDRCTQTNKA
jgi:uncharacterized protein DUF2442